MPQEIAARRRTRSALTASLLGGLALSWLAGCSTGSDTLKGDSATADPYAAYVWPPPPDTPRIKLTTIISGRSDVETTSKLSKMLLGASPEDIYDHLRKPFGVEFDTQGRILVTESALGALLRFDRKGGRMDVFGTTGAVHLRVPLGLGLGKDGTIYVTSSAAQQVVAFDEDGKLKSVYGRPGDLTNPTDVAVSPDGTKIYVTDSRSHKIVIFDTKTAKVVGHLGRPGEGEGEFNYPTALTFAADGNLLVVDQMNARVQIFDSQGDFVELFGGRGVGFGNFARPKDVAIDADGIIYVTDAAFNNVQLFDRDLTLLTFVGEGGVGPGTFNIAAGAAAHRDEFAVVDQLNGRLQVFRFVGPKTGE